jgi:hypothetical protein
MSRRRVVFLFPTTHAVMQASQVLENAGVKHEVVPRPKGVNADCGIAVALAPALRQEAAEALREGACEPSRVAELEKPDLAQAARRRRARDE